MAGLGMGELMSFVNSDLNVPMNHLIWLNDYKTYGEDSYVFQNKDILHELYVSPISSYDNTIFEEAIAYNRKYMPLDALVKWIGNRYDFGDRNEDEIKYFVKGFNYWTDDELVSALYKHYNDEIDISKCVEIGEKRSITLSAIEATGVGESHVEQVVEFVIADIEHDDLVEPINNHTKAAITLTQVDLFKNGGTIENGYMNPSNTNSGGWESCARRTWCNDVCYNAFPATFKNVVKPVKKLTSVGNQSKNISETVDKIFLLSDVEIYGNNNVSAAGEGYQYEYYKTTENRNKSSAQWYMRSPYIKDSTEFCVVWDNLGQWYASASTKYGISTGLCI